MRTFWFEIVRRPDGQFAWVLVEQRGGSTRIVARSERSYRSMQRVRRAIERLQAGISQADIVVDDGAADLPATTFEMAPYTLPLVVGSATADGPGGRNRFDSAPATVSTDAEPTTGAGEDESPPAAAAAPAPPDETGAGGTTAQRSRAARTGGRGSGARPTKRASSTTSSARS